MSFKIDTLKEEIAMLDAKNSVKDKLLAKAEAKMEALEMDNEQLKSDIANERMNLEKVQELYEERACLCEEQERRILELEAEIEELKSDKERLENDVWDAEINRGFAEQQTTIIGDSCRELQKKIDKLEFVLFDYPYVVLLGSGAIAAENRGEYEKLLDSISVEAVNDVLEELKYTLVINNEGNTEFFDYVYTLETIEGLKNRGVIFNVK